MSVDFVSSNAGGWRAEHAPGASLVRRPAARTAPGRAAAERVLLGTVIAEALSALHRQAGQRIVSVQSDLRPADLARPVDDAAALGAVLHRVLANGVHHSVDGKAVCLGLAGTGGGAVLTVAHTAPDMGEAAAAALAGLGRGVTVQGVPGGGTRVCIPLRHAAPAEADQHDGLVRTDEPEGTVLCIEDHEVDYFLVEEALSRWPKVQVLHAGNVRAALDMIATLQPTVTLLDMRLADGTGLEVLRPIRRNPATADLRVFMLSADALPNQMRAAFDAGADGYWTKPLDIEHFLAKMEELLLRDRSRCSPA